ncbi:MAG TPA: FAD-dependent oxidoreductase [Solirubrobacteraceae bacterium]|nr:FAD-dependent oxidoreductase [Solirubrobacteraceae bacterium]
MTTQASTSSKFRVSIVGGGVAAIEAALALSELAPQQTDVTVIAPDSELVYRPMAVTEPFSFGGANHYTLAPIVADAGAQLLADKLDWIEPEQNKLHTAAGETIDYDALILAIGARPRPRYEHCTTIDDRRLDGLLHGLIQDIEDGYVKSIAFVSPGRMPWPLPLYELALMTAGRAYDAQEQLSTTLITPEDAPLGIFGQTASNAVAEVLQRANIETITSAYAEVPARGEVAINPGDRRLKVDRIVALPELGGPVVRGIPLGEAGFIRVDQHGRLRDLDAPIFAAGDAIDFPIKQGGLGCQQADAAAEAVAALAGAPVTPAPFRPVMRAKLLTADEPLYLSAQISGGQGFSSHASSTPSWSPPSKVAARYLAPYLDKLDRAADAARRAGHEPQTGAIAATAASG